MTSRLMYTSFNFPKGKLSNGLSFALWLVTSRIMTCSRISLMGFHKFTLQVHPFIYIIVSPFTFCCSTAVCIARIFCFMVLLWWPCINWIRQGGGSWWTSVPVRGGHRLWLCCFRGGGGWTCLHTLLILPWLRQFFFDSL